MDRYRCRQEESNVNHTTKTRRKLYRYRSLMLCIFMALMLFTVSASAEEASKNTVRVGAFEGTYNIVNEKGERSGYGYEYLQNIAGYAGWICEYVDSDWSDVFSQLERGDIDIVGGISYTGERARSMFFSDLPMGEEKYYIYTDTTNTQLSAADIRSFNGKKIGVLKDYIPEDVLNAWEQRHHLHMNHLNVSTSEEILAKMANHEIDCFVSTEDVRWADMGMSSVTNIGESDIYFAISKKRPELKDALDTAMRRIENDNPFYTDDLYRRYLSAQNRAVLTDVEKNWLSEHGRIRIGYLNNDTGVSMMNPVTGELTGVLTDYIQLARNCLQGQTLEFEVHGYDTRAKQLMALHQNEIDLIFHVSQNPYSAEVNHFVLSDTVWTFHMAAISAQTSFDENAENTVAVLKGNFALKAYISYNYPQWTVHEYETQSAAAHAMKTGEADCILVNSGAVSNYLRDKKLHSIFLTKPADVSFALQQGEPTLLSIMNKTLRSVSTSKLSGAVVSYSNASRKVTMAEYIQDNLPQVTLLLTVLLLVILSVILRFLQKSRRAEARATQAAAQAMELNQQLESQQQKLQNALTAAQSANEAKTIFLNNMSHDIRTPINGIIGMLTILEQNEDDPDRVKDCLHKIDMSSQLLLSLINDVLDMAKLESGTLVLDTESVELDEVCDEVTSTLQFQAENAGLTVTGDHDDYRGLYVFSSSLHLKKVLMNLFTNSIKYNKTHGSIHMSMKTLSRTEDTITIEFQISDTGIGMSEDFIKNKLFTPFVQADNTSRTHYKGTGLGMPIVKSIVEQMHGTISVESRLGEGSCFTVVLPFKIDRCELPEEKKEKKPATIAGSHLLLAEDNELNAEIAEYLLTGNGAQVETVKTGLEALQKFEGSEPGTYDAILMDVMMPEMDGLAATKAIRALTRSDAKTIPIIAMTANAFAEDAKRCLEAGMNAHLSKPLDAVKVMETISRFTVNLEKSYTKVFSTGAGPVKKDSPEAIFTYLDIRSVLWQDEFMGVKEEPL